MFERYTQVARRVIFIARYEASALGSPHIECGHLILGLFREDTPLRRQLEESQREQIRTSIAGRAARTLEKTTSVDLPLSQDVEMTTG